MKAIRRKTSLSTTGGEPTGDMGAHGDLAQVLWTLARSTRDVRYVFYGAGQRLVWLTGRKKLATAPGGTDRVPRTEWWDGVFTASSWIDA